MAEREPEPRAKHTFGRARDLTHARFAGNSARLKNLFDSSARPDVIGEHLSVDRRLARVGGPLSRLASAGGVRRVRAGGSRDSRPAYLRAGGDDARRPHGRSVRRTARNAGARADASRSHSSTTCICRRDGTDLVRCGPAGAASIRAIAAAVASGEIDLEPGTDPEAAIRKLESLPGIGDWTAQYVAMRALCWPDAFPAGDLGLLKAWGETSAQRLRDASRAWRPWRAYAAIYIWEGHTSLKRRTTMIDVSCQGVRYTVHPSPIGDLMLTSNGAALTGLYMCEHRGRDPSGRNRAGNGTTWRLQRSVNN